MSLFRSLLMQKKDDANDYIKNGLQVYYSGIDNTGSGYDRTATTWADLSGNNNTGKMYKFDNGNGDLSGWSTNGLKFRLNLNNNGVVTINDKNMVDLFSNMPFTISCTYTVRNAGTYMGLFGNHGVGNAGFLVQYEGNNSGVGWLGGTGRSISSSLWSASGSKHNLTLVFMSYTRAILYIDGVEIYDKDTFSGSLDSSMIFTIGNAFLQANAPQNAPRGRTFDGTIHNFLLYNRALSETEVQHNYSIDLLKYFS